MKALPLFVLAALLLGITGCVAQKEAPATQAPEEPVTPSEPEISSEVEEIIGISEEARATTEPTDEIAAPEFEVSEPVDLGSVI